MPLCHWLEANQLVWAAVGAWLCVAVKSVGGLLLGGTRGVRGLLCICIAPNVFLLEIN